MKNEKNDLIRDAYNKEKDQVNIKPHVKTPRMEVIFKDVCGINDNIIKKFNKVVPVCLAYTKDGTGSIFNLCFDTPEAKENIRLKLLQHLVKMDLMGYIIIFDCKVTKYNQKNLKEKPKVFDVVMRTLYTPKKRMSQMVTYKDKKIIKKEKLPQSKSFDNWDLWNHGINPDKEDKTIKEYNKFKQQNPELYKDVS